MTELAAFVLTLVTLGMLTTVGVVGIALMKRVLGVEPTPEPTPLPDADTDPTLPPRGAV